MKYVLILSALVLLGYSQSATAACNVLPPAQVNLGQSVPSTNVNAGRLLGDSSFTVNCERNVLLSVLNLDTTGYTVTASTNTFRLSNGRDFIPYQLSSAANFNTVISQVGQGYTTISPTLLTLLGGTNVLVPLFVRTNASNVSSGVYSDQLTIRVQGRYCAVQLLGLVCVTWAPPVDALITLNVQLTVDRTCSVTMPAQHNLGTIGFVEELGDVPMDINVNCTRREAYRLYVDMGNNSQAGIRRLAHQSVAELLGYRILLPASEVDLTPGAPMQRVGMGNVELVRPRVRLQPRASAPTPGLYTDTVRAVIQY